ncbi:MAG: TonB-dependent receptor [Bacteroidetes bacterium]|nr:TonB-dependent receptor [Bacteroidota bacterium]
MKKSSVLLFCHILGGILFAQQDQKLESLDTVIIDTKIPIARKNSGKVVIKITAETLERKSGMSLAQVINEVSGIEINGNRSNEGQNLGYYVRGGRNRQVVIMIDGVQLNDPSQIANDYDLRLIPASSIESIEIVKGASSVLYGSGAGTAVISITTKKASGKKISARITSTLGTNRAANDKDNDIEEFTNYVNINGTLNRFFYVTSFANRFVKGLSAVTAPEEQENFDEDVFNRYNGKIDLGYNITDKITLSRFFSFDKYKAEFDDFNYFDADNLSISEQLRTGGNFVWKYKKGFFLINDNYSWITREIESSFPTKFDSRSYTFDAYATYKFNNELSILTGINGNFSSFNSFTVPFGESEFIQAIDDDTAKFEIIDPYVSLVYISGFGLNINTGVRINNHSNYGTHVVFNFNPSYVFPIGKNHFKLLSTYSTAYITPSLFQLYAPSFGNEDLVPEENTTIEGGIEFTSDNNSRMSVVYFNRDEENYVDFVLIDPDLFIFQYQNVSEEFTASGVEVEVFVKLSKKINLTANYTNTQADERFALRIPEHKANLYIGFTPGKKVDLGLSYQYNSKRDDSFFNSDTFQTESVVLDSYGILDLYTGYQATDHIKLFAYLSNLIDEEYEELYRFQTHGRNVRVGFTLEF